MKTIKLLVADSNTAFCDDLRKACENDGGVQVVACADDGISAIRAIREHTPDVVVLDILLPVMDGYSVMSDHYDKKPTFMVATGLVNDALINKAFGAGAEYFLVKPVRPELIIERVKEFCAKPQQPATPVIKQPAKKTADEKLANIFLSLGIPAHIKGYKFMREAVKLTVDDPQMINAITKKLYPAVASMFETTPSKVERAIRHAIEVAWNRGRMETINSLFGFKVYTPNDKPTNGEFIALLADKLILEGF